MWSRSSVGLLLRAISGGNVVNVSCKRRFLSPAFLCEDSWKKRLQTPVIRKCVLDDFYYELDSKYNQSENINPLDVDIFVNATTDSTYLDEMQDLVHKMRLSTEAMNILPSTQHAFIRIMLECKRYDELITVLNDRLNYGIFPDDYCTLLMFDLFLKGKNYKNAAKVASLQMLQEDYSNPLINYLSLYSCHQYLMNPSEWEKAKEEPPEEDDEEIKVRVNYIRNPFFDEHFDLTQSDDLIGKTFTMIGKELNDDVGRSYELLGYILFKKFIPAQNLLKSMIGNKEILYKDIFSLIMSNLEERLKSDDKGDEQTLKLIESIKAACEELMANKLLSDKDVLPLLEDKIKELVKESENEMIAQQQSIYANWIEARDHLLSETLDRIRRDERLQRVQQIKEELSRREQELFFFDKEDQLDLDIEKKKEVAESIFSGDNTNKQGANLADYVPPDIEKRRNTKF